MRLIARCASGAPHDNFSINSSTALPSISCGTTRETMPRRNASSALTSSPDNNSSIARDTPMMRGSRYVPPTLPITPRRTKYDPSFAWSDAIRMSHSNARSMPMPTAAPLMAAMVGLVQFSIELTIGVAAPRLDR